MTVYIHGVKSPMLRESLHPHWLNAGAVCLNFNLRRTSRSVTQYYDEALKPTGVKVTQFTILIAIATHTNAGGGSITDIARLAMVDRTTLTRSVKILENENFISIDKAQPGNKKCVKITPTGLLKLNEVYPYWFQAQRALARKLTPAKTRELRHLLVAIKNSAETLHAI